MANVKQIKINDTVYDVEDSVARSALQQKSPLESPALTGTPTAPTATKGTNTTQIATTAFVQDAVQGAGGSYTLPVASSTTLGGVKPVTKTSAMTQQVGVDANGALYTEPGSGGGGSTDISLGITGAAAGEFPKVSAVNENGAPTSWETVEGEEVTLGSGDEWVKVAETTLTKIANEIRLNFDPCKAVYIEFQYGAVENDLGVIGIYPNPKTPVYTSEQRAAASIQKTSATNKRGYIFCTIDCRKGTQWVATSQTFSRGDGTFGSIEPGATMNCDISVLNNNTWASLLWKQQMANADHINSVSAFGAGMNIGTTLTVWGIKA